MAVTLAQLRTRVRQRSDNEHTGQFVTDAELNQLINTRYKELYELLVIHGLHRAESVQTISPTTAASSYALNSDFFAVLGVWRIDPALGPIWLSRHDHRTMPDTAQPADAESYRIVGVTIEFNPVANDGTYKVKYVPVPGDMADDDNDDIDGVLGWEEYVVVGAAIDVLTKEEAEEAALQSLHGHLAQLRDRIKFAAQQVELSEMPAIANTRASYFDRRKLPGDWNVFGYRGPLW